MNLPQPSIKKNISMMVLKLYEQSLRVFSLSLSLSVPQVNLFIRSTESIFARNFKQNWFESDIGMGYHLTVLSGKTVEADSQEKLVYFVNSTVIFNHVWVL